MILAMATLWLWVPALWIPFLLMLPLIIDGTIQQKTRYESNNTRRCLTGILYGYAMIVLIFLFLRSGFYTGLRIAEWMKNR